MDRKARIREYKETPRPMGVFRVRNTTNGASLVGSSTDLPAMLNRQRFQLELGSHPNRALQKDWNELGPTPFEFEVLDTLEPTEQSDHDVSEDLEVLLEMWLQKLSLSEAPGYNGDPRPGTR
jgi:hypothetical protein